MKITSVEPVLLGYQKSDPPMSRSFGLVKVVTDEGLTGWGEASTNWGHSYPSVFAATVKDVCAPALLGADPTDVRARVADLHVRLDGYLGWEGLTSQTIGAIEMALWDVLGRWLDAPVHQLLGAGHRDIALYGTGTTMFEADTDFHAHYFDAALAAGFEAVKVRLGRSVAEDISVVRAVRDHVGSNVDIGVDSYWFHDARTALRLAEHLNELGVFFFEEPIPQYRTTELAWLSRRSPIPIAVGERVYSPWRYQELATAEAAHVFQPDAQICGGLLACLEISATAEKHGIQVLPHVGGPTAVGLAANLHWVAAAGLQMMEFDIDPYQPLVDELAPFFSLAAITDGSLRPPLDPGLGITVPDDIAERYPYLPGDTYADVFPDHERGVSRGP